MESHDLARQIERSAQEALAIDERVRAELERKPTAALVEELSRIEQTDVEPDRRRLEAISAARADAERDLERAQTVLGDGEPTDRRERARLEAIVEHAGERLDALRTQEHASRDLMPEASTSERERGAAIERILAQRRRLRVEAAIRMEPAYLTQALGQRPEGLRQRLDWERAVDVLERHRQRLSIRDPDQALGDEPNASIEKARWQTAHRELDVFRARVIEGDVGRARGATAALDIER